MPPMPASAAFAFVVFVPEFPLEHADHACARPLGQALETGAQRGRVERLEAEEDRQQQHGREVRIDTSSAAQTQRRRRATTTPERPASSSTASTPGP